MTYRRHSTRPGYGPTPGNLQAGAGPTPIGATVPNSGNGGSGGFHPTVAHLLVLLVLEIVAFAALRYLFAKVHV